MFYNIAWWLIRNIYNCQFYLCNIWVTVVNNVINLLGYKCNVAKISSVSLDFFIEKNGRNIYVKIQACFCPEML